MSTAPWMTHFVLRVTRTHSETSEDQRDIWLLLDALMLAKISMTHGEYLWTVEWSWVELGASDGLALVSPGQGLQAMGYYFQPFAVIGCKCTILSLKSFSLRS